MGNASGGLRLLLHGLPAPSILGLCAGDELGALGLNVDEVQNAPGPLI